MLILYMFVDTCPALFCSLGCFYYSDADVSELDAIISHHETVRRMQSDLESKNAEIENLRKAVVDAETGLEEMTEVNKQLT